MNKKLITLQIEIDDILYHLVLLPDLDLVEYYELVMVYLVQDLVQYQFEQVQLDYEHLKLENKWKWVNGKGFLVFKM